MAEKPATEQVNKLEIVKTTLSQELGNVVDSLKRNPPTLAALPEYGRFYEDEGFHANLRSIAQQTGAVIVDDLVAGYKMRSMVDEAPVNIPGFLKEGEKLITWCFKIGPSILEEEAFSGKNLMKHFSRAGWVDESLEPERYQELQEKLVEMGKRSKEGFSDYASAVQFVIDEWKIPETISRREKTWVMYGAFSWALARGWPGWAISALRTIAEVQERPPAQIINNLIPVISSMRIQAQELGKREGDTKMQPAIGNHSTREYIRGLDEAMKEQSFLFDEKANVYINLSFTD